MTFHPLRPLGLAAGLWLSLVSVASAQPPDARQSFTAALGAFSLALRGELGDEGPRLRLSLDQMRRALAAWDAAIRASEQGMARELPGAEPALAARMHLALGAVYLDRGRIDDGLRELGAAAALDGSRADLRMLQGLTRRQLQRTPAIEEFRAAAALAPSDPVQAYQLARSLTTAGRDDEAIGVLELVSKSQIPNPKSQIPTLFLVLGLVQEVPGVEPFFPPAVYARGFSLLDAGDYAGAISELAAALERDPLAAEPGVETGAVTRAAAALREGGTQTAIQQLTLATELEPQRAEPQRLLGLAYLAQGQHEQAVAALTRAAAINSSDERSRLALARALVQSDRTDLALDSLNATIAAIPGSGQARYELGLVHQRAGRYAEALAAFDQALSLEPLLGANSIHQTIGALRRSQQDFDGAARAFSTRVDLVPNDAGAHRELGDIYLRQGRHTEALAEFAVVLMLDPASIEAHAAMAQIHLRDQRYPEAVDAATRVIGLDPGHREGRYALATALVRLGRTDEGRRELEIVRTQQAEDTAARARVFELEGLRREAAISAAAGERDKAIALLQKVVDADPTMSGSLIDLGFALIDGGRHAEAVPLLEQAVQLGAHHEVHRHLAAAYGVLGRDEESRRERERYEQLQREALRRTGSTP